jgi:hypothetical protein
LFGPGVPESAVEEVRDRLEGLLPEDALQDALDGVRPEEITVRSELPESGRQRRSVVK